MSKNILSLDIINVEGNLWAVFFALQEGKEYKTLFGVKSIYFAGSTLCMDIDGDVLTLRHSNEDIGYLSGGLRRLLPLVCMELMEAIMDMAGVKHTQKWVTKRIVNS